MPAKPQHSPTRWPKADWPDFGSCGEYGGKDKYGRLLRPRQTTKDAVLFEKQREEVLRGHGRWPIRWSKDDLKDRKQFYRIITTGLNHGLRARRERKR